MSGRKEQEYILREAARRELAMGRIDRREFITRGLVVALGLAGVGTVAKSTVGTAFAADRPLTPTFYQWINDLHPGIPAVNAEFPGINYQIAPVEASAPSGLSPKPRVSRGCLITISLWPSLQPNNTGRVLAAVLDEIR
jgi:hypothetical protein